MPNFNHGGVQPHSVGSHYPIIVVGYGDGTWRAEYGGAKSAPVPSAKAATHLATLAYGVLVTFNGETCKDWLVNLGFQAWLTGPANKDSVKQPSQAVAWVLGGARIDVYLQLTNAAGHRLVNSRTFASHEEAADFQEALCLLIGAKAKDSVLLSLFNK